MLRNITQKQPDPNILTKWSKPYTDKPFLYCWDVSPACLKKLHRYQSVDFAQKDTGLRCRIPTDQLKKRLTPNRQTTRSTGHWGIRILKNHSTQLAIDPAQAETNPTSSSP